jgi:effector-binding domain-containing protein
MKVMISQPMYGKTEKQIREERAELIKKIEAEGDTYIDTIFTGEAPKDTDAAIYYLAKSIEKLAEADKVIFMQGWDKARGCIVEHEVALSYGLLISYCKENEDD